jgi:hypothetical protein
MPRYRGCVVHGMWLTQRAGATRKDLDAVERCPLSMQRISEAAARVTWPVADLGETGEAGCRHAPQRNKHRSQPRPLLL